MGEQSLEIWIGIASVIGVLIGGFCTILGSYIASSRQVKAQKEIFADEINERYSQQRKELKLSLLADFMGHRNAIVGNSPGMSQARGISDNSIFFSALNKIGVIFSDSPKVLDSYNNFRKIIIQKDIHSHAREMIRTGVGMTELVESQTTTDSALYQLAVGMHEDLNIIPPDEETFFKPLRM
ncbi:hypothetical protein RYX56_06345 [Alkalihalophilus lindianensis]|uniref:Uncharacterized protein n=1 Tax=Alkalihalophilus lindianensis TaxID=1630542 RepID=A0ABU3X7X4_9BACI|nr:hypothetical protein [Alkalihalophilus lindianensis]MDV2683991.1 hypothetical protein [Alkalihalophilus lindianensis]